MQAPPRYEKRPGVSYYAGRIVARGCFTHSILLNAVRLVALWYAVPQFVLLASGKGSWLVCSLSITVLVVSFVVRPRNAVPQTTALERWTADERKLATIVDQAAQIDRVAVEAIQDAFGELPAVDYGITSEGRIVCAAQDLRGAHQLVTGSTGSGKSKFLATQAAQAAVLGASLVVVDPHEDIAPDVLRTAAHVLAHHGIILLWPGGPQHHLYPWNPLWTGPGRASWQAADSVIGAVKRVWGLSDQNTYIIDVIRHTAWALAEVGWTLLEGRRFLTDEVFRNYIVEQADLPEVSSWVSAYNALRPRERSELVQTTLVRLARFASNPYLQQMIGAGVADQRYVAARQQAGLPIIAGAELGEAINNGHHVFAVLPRRRLGEDQFLVAGLVQAILLEAAFRRPANDPTIPLTEAYLDEAAVYATAEGLGVMLPQTRKYNLSLSIAMQGVHQAEQSLRDELQTNTRIKVVFATDHPEEAMSAAGSLYKFDPLLIKVDARQQIGEQDERREVGQFQTYPPQEQQAFYASQIGHLPPRHYLLKVRGSGDPLEVITPTYTARYGLDEAVRLAGSRRVAQLINPDDLGAELRWRWDWLQRRSYRPKAVAMSTPTFGGKPKRPEPRAKAAKANAPTNIAAVQNEVDTAVNDAAAHTRPETPQPTAPAAINIPTTFGGDDAA